MAVSRFRPATRALGEFARSLSGLLVERILLSGTQLHGDLPRPSGDPHVHAMGPDPDRILLIGGGPVRGLGVASHELGIGGYLARRLSALTGRGVDVELIGVPGLTPRAAGRLVRDVDLSRYDAIVLLLGVREAMSLRPVEAWRRDIRALLEALVTSAPPAVSLFVVGVPRLSAVLPMGKHVGPPVARQVDRLNEATLDMSVATGAYFVPMLSGREVHAGGSAAIYSAWAEPIAEHMYRSLDAAASTPHPQSRADEAARQSALDGMGIVDRPPTAELDALARVAQELFGVLGASVNLIDNDRQQMHATYGFDKVDLPRSESFCAVTVDLGRTLVVEDTRLDPRFNRLPAVVEHGIHFYAGYPVEAPNGQRIGTLCLFDTAPRSFSVADRSLLRELALRVQSELWTRVRVP